MTEDDEEPASRPAGGWGCTLAGFFLLGSIGVAFKAPAVGIPLTLVAAVVAWRVAKKDGAVYARQEAKRRALGPPVGDIWRRLFEQEGLGDLVDSVAPHVRPALRLVTTRAETIERGRSRVGGTPDLPPGRAWPRREGRPLAFLAQLDLAEVAQALEGGPLPKSGHLWFFFDLVKWPAGSQPTDAGGAPVLFDGGDAVEPATPPDDLDREHRFPPCSVAFERFEDVPDIDGVPQLSDRLKDDARWETYIDLFFYLGAGWATDPHRLLGFARPVQDTMEEECQMVSNGITFGQRKKRAERVEELRAGVRDWRLLLEVESDGNAGMMWGDAGSLYFWIREQDLREARFDRTWTIFQCH